jgi:tetratricopeptide (TPR) repeat protein
MKKIMTLFCFLLSIHPAFSQNADIDSMLQKIAAEKDDSRRIDIIYSSLVIIGETNPVLRLKYAQKLLDYSQINKDKIGEAYAISYMGKMYGVSGNMEKGLGYALKGKEIAEQTNNEKLLAISNTFLGLIYKFLANFPKAISFYMASVQSAEKANYQQAQVMGFQNLSEIYLTINQVDSALMYAQKDYELSQRIKYFDFFSYTLINLGAVHGKLGNSAVALGYFDMAIQESYKSKSLRQLNRAFTAKAKYFNDISQKDSSIIYAKKAITVVQNTDFASNSIKPAQLLLDIYRGNNVDSAFKYSELSRITNDSLFNAKAIQQTQLMTFEDELRQQKSAEEKIKEEEQRKQNIQYALLALGIITFIILFLMLSRRHITNTKLIQFLGVVALLLVFEFLNLLLHPFLERITHHSPVLMLLALVCIAALLVPLHHKLEKWATHKLVEKNKQIRLAAAKKTIQELERK